ncbi:MAG: alpha/beta hydrolase, partial [Spirochaetales bacterium]|nr:alpha/beta hydrolase [Spirochaetales bacterium]
MWLDGGPGGTEVGWVRTYLGELHKYFTIVCWDQRGVGKSFNALDSVEDVTVDQFVEDVTALSELLVKDYRKEKIVLAGHSWGSIIGLKAAHRHPELFSAYIGAAQQINSIENDTISWKVVREGADAAGDVKVVRQLDEYGRPPYGAFKPDGSWKGDGAAYYYLLSRIYTYTPHAPADSGFRSLDMFLAPEHNFFDRIRNVKGLIRGVKHIYPQLAFLDFEQKVKRLEIPLFLVSGRYDFT